MTDWRLTDELAAAGTPMPAAERACPDWGGPLNDQDYVALEASWITPELADAAMLRRVDAQEGRDIVGQKGKRDCAGTLIPYYFPGASNPHSYRIRRDNPDWTADKNGKLNPKAKYLSAPGGGNRLYFPPGVTREQIEDVTIPIIIVEGEKKSLALQRLAYHECPKPRFIPVAISGVWNWRGVTGKAGSASGERIDVKGPIADLSQILWTDRQVTILFDRNVHSNNNVKWARKGIARELATRHARVEFVNLPEDCGVNGIDDLLAAWGPSRVLELFDTPLPAASLQIVLSPQFQMRPEGMFRVTVKGDHLVETQLTNYTASVVTNICLDDGVETKREFEINCRLHNRPFVFNIPASQFSQMEWAIEQMGSNAITYPNQREYARTAIQTHSITAEERSIYTHTGWRNIDGNWVFLHGGGAITADGTITSINVQLHGALAHYQLSLASTPEALAFAVRSSLRLVELAPAPISFPLMAAVFRAVLGQADFALHLAGETGAFKSELAALFQQFFGAGMTRLNLPGSWSSTGNSLEVLAFHCKDALLVIDDFAPQGNAADVARYHAAADRVFRAAGNRTGRGRLDSTAKLRESKPPRGLILSTGEDIPRGHSIRARLLILELSKAVIDTRKLSECQKSAADGLHAQAMAGFLQWTAGRFDDMMAAFKVEVNKFRSLALADAAHARTPDMIAGLQAAFTMYMEFSEASGAVCADLRKQLTDQCWSALCEAASAQGKHQAASEPAARYISLLRACLSSGLAHLAPRKGNIPDSSPVACGWRNDGSHWHCQGRCIGWTDGDDIYIEPTTAYEVIQISGRNAGDVLPIGEQTLTKRLREKGLLASTDKNRGTLTIRRAIAGASMDVLHFRRTTILPEGIDEQDIDQAVNY